MPLSKYRPCTAFPGSAQAPTVGWGKLGCRKESLLMNSSSAANSLFSSVFFYIVMVFNWDVSLRGLNHWCGPWWAWQPWGRSNAFTHRGWLLFVLRSRVKYTHSKAAACSGSPDGHGVIFQEGSLLALNLGSWHQIRWKILKLPSHLTTSEGKVNCHADAWNVSGLRQCGAVSIKSGPSPMPRHAYWSVNCYTLPRGLFDNIYLI